MKLYNAIGDVIVDYKKCETKKEAVEKAVKNKVSLSSVNLQNTKLLGADLTGADLLNANLIDANLIEVKLIYANLTYANFSRSNLAAADLIDADLRRAVFSRAKMRGAILPFDKYDVPIISDIHKKVYEACSVKETFDMGEEWCGTTKCIAGWTCTIAGERGLALAKEIGYDAAASLIYMRSDPNLERLPNYYASNEDALKELEMLANK